MPVFRHPHRWHVNLTLVASWLWFWYFPYNCHLQLPVPIHEVLPEPPWVFCPLLAPVYWTRHRLQTPAGMTPFMSPSPLCQRLPPGSVAGLSHVIYPCGELVMTPPSPPPALLATHPGFLPLPKRGPISHYSPILRQCPILYPNKTQGAHHCFDLTNIC